MSSRYARSRTNLALASTPNVRPSGVLSHAVPEFVGESRGIDPSAGHREMSAAFSQFFGSMQTSMDTFIEGHRAVEKHNIDLQNKELAKIAQTEAGRVYERHTDMSYQEKLGQVPKLVTLQNGEVIDPSTRRSFTDTFSSSLGTLSGQKLIRNLKTELVEQQVTPENFDNFVNEYWKNNYNQGTGNPYHDKALQDSWQTEIDSLRLNNELKVLERAQGKRLEAVNEVIYSRGLTPDGFTQSNFLFDLSSVRAALPSLTDGQARSHVLSQYIASAKKTANGARALMRFFDRPFFDTGEEGATGEVLSSPSLNTLFPQQMAAHEAALHKAIESHVTIEGSDRVAAISSQFATIESMPETSYQQVVQKSVLLAQFGTNQMQSLPHIEGASQKAIRQLKVKYAKEFAEHRTKHITINKLFKATSHDGGRHFPLNQKELEMAVPYLVSRYDFRVTGNKQDAHELGRRFHILRRKYNNFLPEGAKDVLASGLMSTNVPTRESAMEAVRATDPEGYWIRNEFKKHPKVLSILTALYTPGENIATVTENAATAQNLEQQGLPTNLGDYYRSIGEIEDIKGLTKDQVTNAWINEKLFSDTGLTVHNTLLEQIVDRSGLNPFSDDLRMTPEVREAILAHANQLVVEHQEMTMGYGHSQPLPVDELRARLAARFGPLVVVSGDQVQFADSITSLTQDAVNNVPLARAVLAPNGEFQDTALNMSNAVEMIHEGLIGLHRGPGYAQGSFVEEGDIILKDHEGLTGKNAKMLYDRVTRDPVRLTIGKPYETQTIFDPEGKEYGYMARAFNWGEADEEHTVKFTGQLTADLATARRFLHPAIKLVPIREGNVRDGKIIGYNLAASPFFEGQDGLIELKDMVNRKGPWVPEKALTPRQRKLQNPKTPAHLKILGSGFGT